MANTDYVKQSVTKPAYDDMLWDKPETKRTAGKLLVVGGNVQGISAPLQAYKTSEEAGIGHARVLLPNSLRPMVGKIIEHGDYAPSTPSGSFSKRALSELLDMSGWADVVLLAGDFGRNSETAILLESFLAKTSQPVVATKDAADYITTTPGMHTAEGALTLVLSLSQLQKYQKQLGHKQAVTFDMNLLQLISLLKEFVIATGNTIITKHHNNILLAHNSGVSVTQHTSQLDIWRAQTAAYVSVWLAQQPNKPFKALTTAIYEAVQEK